MLRFLVVGVGQCGNRVADAVAREAKAPTGMGRFFGSRKASHQVRVMAVNSAENDLKELRFVPPGDRVLLKGGSSGSGANREVAKVMFQESRARVQAAVHAAAPWDACVILTSSGGGTGSGSAPALVDLLRNLVPAPVLAVSVLPFKEESDVFIQNTGFALKDLRTAKPTTVLLASNDFLKQASASIVEAYDHINTLIAGRLLFLMESLASEMMMSADLGDLQTVLASGSGFSTFGYIQGTPHQPLREVIEASFATPNLLFQADAFKEASRAMLIIEGGEEHLRMEDLTAAVAAFSQKVGDVFKAVRVTAGPPKVLSLFSLDSSVELERVLDASFQVIEKRKAKKQDTEAESKLASKFDRVAGYDIDE